MVNRSFRQLKGQKLQRKQPKKIRNKTKLLRRRQVFGRRLIQGVGFSVHAGLPGVPGHVRHGDEEQGHPAQDEQGEGGARAGERPGVVVLDPNGLVAVDHPLDGLAHHLHRDDDAKACGPKRKTEDRRWLKKPLLSHRWHPGFSFAFTLHDCRFPLSV